MAIDAKRRKVRKFCLPPAPNLEINDRKTVTTGIHEVYWEMDRQIGLHLVLPEERFPVSNMALFHTVMARIASPASKLVSAIYLETEFGVGIPLEKLYRMLNHLDVRRIDHAHKLVGAASRTAIPDLELALIYESTTLAFESTNEDDLHQKGFSKGRKFHESQVVLSLAVSREGLPFACDVQPSETSEGASLLPLLRKAWQLPGVKRVVCIASRGLFSEPNLAAIDGCHVFDD